VKISFKFGITLSINEPEEIEEKTPAIGFEMGGVEDDDEYEPVFPE